jgi:hypothetical protein
MPAASRDHTWNADEAALDEGLTPFRNLRLSKAEITLATVRQGGTWKATAEGLPALQGLEFYGPTPKAALDSAESFVRRLITQTAAE